MSVACFEDAIDQFNQVDHVVTPLEKLSAVKSTLDLISGTVVEYIKEHGYENAGKLCFFFINDVLFKFIRKKIRRLLRMRLFLYWRLWLYKVMSQELQVLFIIYNTIDLSKQ